MANEINVLSIGGVDYSIIDTIYPVGSIYMSVNSTNPGTIFGGTWEQIQDTFLLAAGQTYTAGATGGEAEHTLTQSEMPTHTHPSASGWGIPEIRYVADKSGIWPVQIQADGEHLIFGAVDDGTTYMAIQGATGSKGGNAAHNNMPPYLAVYVWKRTA